MQRYADPSKGLFRVDISKCVQTDTAVSEHVPAQLSFYRKPERGINFTAVSTAK
jgi:hypothetical protein